MFADSRHSSELESADVGTVGSFGHKSVFGVAERDGVSACGDGEGFPIPRLLAAESGGFFAIDKDGEFVVSGFGASFPVEGKPRGCGGGELHGDLGVPSVGYLATYTGFGEVGIFRQVV